MSPDSAVSEVRTCISEQKQSLCFGWRALLFHSSSWHYAQYIHESIPHIVYISVPQSGHAPATLNSTLFVNCQPPSTQLYSHAPYNTSRYYLPCLIPCHVIHHVIHTASSHHIQSLQLVMVHIMCNRSDCVTYMSSTILCIVLL